MTVQNESEAATALVARGIVVHRATDDQVAVYRLLDGTGGLLYVGISKDPFVRWQEHLSKSWWRQVVSYEVQWFPTRAEARAEEKRAMANEAAAHNIHSAPRHGAHWRAVTNTPEAKSSRERRRMNKARLSGAQDG